MNKKIIWHNRYSDTMLPDEHGRWARIAYCGTNNNLGFRYGKVAR